jgi:membrane-associated phospholipid phosphatase
MYYFLTSFFQNLIGSFKGKKIWFHISAIVLTAIIVFSGFDDFYFSYMTEAGLSRNISSGVKVGGLIPIAIPLALIVCGILLDRFYKRKYGFFGAALAQAAILGSLISSAYKAFTGRIQPTASGLLESHNWNFGFWEHGIFWGWPSSHTTIAFAMAVCLIYVCRKNKYITTLALIYAFWIGIGVTFRIHWFSEFIAGALIGTAIGMTVGKSYISRKLT